MNPSAAKPRRRRADAVRSINAIETAAIEVLATRPDTGMEDIAEAAGVSRQTIYAHYPSRESLMRAVLERLTAQTLADIESVPVREGRAFEALLGMVETSWRGFSRHRLLLRHASAALSGDDSQALHQPVFARFRRLIESGLASGEFDRQLDAQWLLGTTFALGHLAGDEVAAGRLTDEAAMASLRLSLARVFAVTSTQMSQAPPSAAEDA